MTLLLLGGTAEARELAGRLHADGLPVMSSLAGGVTGVLLPAGEVRLGGFGGVAGLTEYLRQHRVSAVVDATHPFAEQITSHAAIACSDVGVPLLRLSRPGWAGHPDATSWHWVEGMAGAKAVAERLGERIFLATGRQTLAGFTEWVERYVLARVVEDPGIELPITWELVRARGPFGIEAERELMHSRRIEVLVTKDSGGPTAAKLDAARQLGVDVVIVSRPPLPEGVAVVSSVAAAADWVQRRRSR